MAVDEIQEVIKRTIQTQVVQALNSVPEAIDKLVKAALSDQVGRDGRPTSYGGMPYLDYLVGEEIRRAARAAVCQVLEDKSTDIEAAIREALSDQDIARAVAKAVVGTAEQDWRIDVQFKPAERDR